MAVRLRIGAFQNGIEQCAQDESSGQEACAPSEASGNLALDAWLATLANESGTEWITTDGATEKLPPFLALVTSRPGRYFRMVGPVHHGGDGDFSI